MKKNKNVGLYVHVPFCAQKCAYCDFYSHSDTKTIDAYTDALISNINKLSPMLSEYSVDTVFFGGGTPSLLGHERFSKICKAISSSLTIDKNLEFTVEVNPATVNAELANSFDKNGVNRVSIGLQSSDERELKALSRIHTFDDFKRTYALISDNVTDNISVDIMYGIPHQNIASLTKTLNDVLALSPMHISAYGLKIEPNTPFGRMGDSLILPTDDQQAQMYKLICTQLEIFGYHRYEISNFSKQNMECRHNLKYWNREEYIGIGPSAYSFFNGYRFSTVRSIKDYISHFDGKPIKIIDEKRILSDTDVFNESIMLGLRLEKGIVPDENTLRRSKYYIDNGFMQINGDRLSFTTEGFLVSNYILSDLID